MATLVKNKDKVWEQGKNENFMDYLKRTDAELERLIKENQVIKFPYADGWAFYEVVSEKPLKLKHLPAGDAWQIDYCHVRGLKLADVKKMLWYDKAIKKVFEREFKPLSSIY